MTETMLLERGWRVIGILIIGLAACACNRPAPPETTSQSIVARTATNAPGGAARGASAPAGACVPPAATVLPVKMFPQHTEKWCWAASAEMIMAFRGADVPQCKQANAELGLSVCCQSPVPDDCIQGGWPEFHKYGYSSVHTTDTALTWAQLTTEIGCEKRPIAFTWHWAGVDGKGHMMVASGYDVRHGENYVVVLDPWPVDSGGDLADTPYDNYVSGEGGGSHTHWDDYYQIHK